MLRDYQITDLSGDSAARAYPLIQAAWPEISLDAWIDYAERINHPDPVLTKAAGIVAAESKRGYIHGLFSYSVRIVLNHGTVLSVENFIAMDMIDRAAAIKSLILVMETLARDLGCSAIHTHIPDGWSDDYSGGGAMMDHLRNAGHSLEFVKFCKTIQGN